MMTYPKQRKFQARNGVNLACEKCGAAIVKGDQYRTVQQGFRGRKMVRCTAVACQFKRSEYTSSKMAGVYAATEQAHEEIDALTETDLASVNDDLAAILSIAADAWREVASEYEEAADAMGDGFGDQTREKAEQINDAADSLEGETVEVEEPGDCDCPPQDDVSDGEDCQTCAEKVAEAIEAVKDEAREALDNAESEIG
jgi:hypothetical protein